MNNTSFTCIIPFYNEGKQILVVLEAISSIKNIEQIICIDDGSTDKVSELIKRKFPQVTLVVSKHNEGKSAAALHGLSIAKHESLLLMDADWQNLNPYEIQQALDKYKLEADIDMLILKFTGNNSWIDEKLRKYIFLSGNRVLKRSDLEKIMKTHPKRYQLEVAINKYMMKYHKKVFWIQTTAFNPHKLKKLGLLKGIHKELEMELDILAYIGIKNYFKQMFLFCRTELR